MTFEKLISGYLYFVEPVVQNNTSIKHKNHMSESQAFENALKAVKADIDKTKLSLDASLHVLWDILQFYTLALDDEVMVNNILEYIHKLHLTAESAVNLYFDQYLDSLVSKDAYFKSRSHDFIDLKNRILSALSVQNSTVILSNYAFKEPTILVFETLYPYELSRIDFKHIIGVISTHGSLHSHVAIILSSLNIPYLILPSIKESFHNHDLIQVNLATSALSKTHQIQSEVFTDENSIEIEASLLEDIHLHPAINLISEIPEVIPTFWSSIGLYRTEFFFMDKNYLPDEIEQYLHYRSICQKALGTRVRFRLLDVELDKPLRVLDNRYFGIDLLLNNRPLLITQLRALLSVSKDYPIGITVPMIESNEQIQTILEVMNDLISQDEFQSEKLNYQFGIMIERKDALKHFDSLSGFDYILIGTNDLSAEYSHYLRSSQTLNQAQYLNKELQEDIVQLIKKTNEKNLLTILCGDGANMLPIMVEYYRQGVLHFAPSPKNISIYRSKHRVNL